jgi:hypothetical protein
MIAYRGAGSPQNRDLRRDHTMEITITIDTNPISWSESETVDDETAARAAYVLGEKMVAGMRAAYPDADVTAQAKWHNEGESIKLVSVSGLGNDVETWEQIQGEAEHLQTAHVYDALAEAIA